MTNEAGLDTGVRVRLSAMMFLQYAFQGIWIIPLATYLSAVGFSDGDIGSAYGMVAIGFIVAPFFVGMVADRFFAAQKVLGVLNILAAGLLFLAARVAVAADGTAQPGLFAWVMLAHCMCYTPSWALTNTIALNQMSNPGKQFPSIRVMGTIGWIVVSAVSLFSAKITGAVGYEGNIEATNLPMILGSVIGLATGLFAFTLPSTPAKKIDKKVTFGDILGVKALALFKDRNFAVFALSSFLIMFAGLFYWNFCNLFLNELDMKFAMFKQSMGQMAELVFLLLMPWFFARWGVKRMLLIGFWAWILRFICFSFGDLGSSTYLLYSGLLLHGVCFDFFFVTGQLYTDKKAPKEIQASAQGLLSLITFGAGWLVGSKLSGYIVGKYAVTEMVEGVEKTVGHDWNTVWLYPAGLAFAFMLLFVFTFKDDVKVGADTEELVAEA